MNSEAVAIGTWEQTLDDYAPYMYELVHLAFPLKKFKTRQAAKDFLAQAFRLDEPQDALQPYLKKSMTRVFEITKDSDTRETYVSAKDEEGEEAFMAFLDSYSA